MRVVGKGFSSLFTDSLCYFYMNLLKKKIYILVFRIFALAVLWGYAVVYAVTSCTALIWVPSLNMICSGLSGTGPCLFFFFFLLI